MLGNPEKVLLDSLETINIRSEGGWYLNAAVPVLKVL